VAHDLITLTPTGVRHIVGPQFRAAVGQQRRVLAKRRLLHTGHGESIAIEKPPCRPRLAPARLRWRPTGIAEREASWQKGRDDISSWWIWWIPGPVTCHPPAALWETATCNGADLRTNTLSTKLVSTSKAGFRSGRVRKVRARFASSWPLFHRRRQSPHTAMLRNYPHGPHPPDGGSGIWRLWACSLHDAGRLDFSFSRWAARLVVVLPQSNTRHTRKTPGAPPSKSLTTRGTASSERASRFVFKTTPLGCATNGPRVWVPLARQPAPPGQPQLVS